LLAGATPAPGAAPGTAATEGAAEKSAMSPEEEAAMREKIERLSGHMFAVM
jgi:hypothetical protein